MSSAVGLTLIGVRSYSMVNDMTEDDGYWRAIENYESARGELDEATEAKRLRDTIAMLEADGATASRDAETLHLLGLCWYHLPDATEQREPRAEASFRAALAVDPGHQSANLFLGYVFFDSARFAEAKERFLRLDAGYFAARGQAWRVAKNDELLLCCQLRMDMAGVTFANLTKVCEHYESDAGVEFAVPAEMIECVDDLIACGMLASQQSEMWARRLLTMLERLGYSEIQYLQASVERLSRMARGPEAS